MLRSKSIYLRSCTCRTLTKRIIRGNNYCQKNLIDSFFFMYLPSPIQDLHPPGLRTQMSVGQMPVGVSNCLWTRTLDRYTRAGLLECVVSKISGPPPVTAQDRTQRTYPIPGQEMDPGPQGSKAGTLPTTRRDGTATGKYN